MSLPFNKPDKNARRWQCFVCGLNHNDYDSCRQHIVDKHEQGRDYVLCPLPRCGAPVRDIKLHFKAKHPTEKMTSTAGQPNKALIWRDFSPTGKKKTRKPRFREGTFISVKNHGKEFYYRSGWECEVYECLEAFHEVIAYEAEPFKDGIPYLFEGSMHKYHPDLAIRFEDGHVEIWEIKPSDQTGLPVNVAKWASADKFCKARGWEFVPVTEVVINKLKARVRRLLAERSPE
jgi:hypothetical protein